MAAPTLRSRALSWSRAMRQTTRSGVRVERTGLTPLLALRGAAGVALVLFGALWLGSPGLAVSSAFGAFAAGIATFQRSWRPRPVLALGAAAGLAVSSFIAYVAVGHPLTFLVVLVLWSFAAGMGWAVGPVTGVVCAFTIAAMLVVVTLPSSVADAALHAGIIAVGGLLQALLIMLFPVRRWGRRRDALADALAAVADYARRLRADHMAPFDPQPLMEARDAAAVTPRQARRRPRQLQGYRTLAESVRPVLASLAHPVVGGAAAEGPERDRVRALLGAAATVLDATARAVRRGERVRIPEGAIDVLQVPRQGPVLPQGPARKAALRLIALMGEVMEAAQQPVEITAAGRPHRRRPTGPGLLRVAERAVRRELRRDSAVLRHAVRLAVVVPAAYLIALALPWEHGYWMPLTVAMVLRPDFSQTYERGTGRLIGTLLGVALGGGAVALVHPAPAVCAALAVLAVGLLYLLMRTGYVVVSACTGAYVVFLLGVVGEKWSQTVGERIVLTLLGGLLALVSYALFPTWESPLLRDRLADWLTAWGRYATALYEAFARPADREPRRVREALLDLRAARREWEQTAARADREPVRHRGMSRRSAAEAQEALVTVGRLAVLLEAHLPEPAAAPEPAAGAYAAALARAVPPAAEAVRGGEPVSWTPVHEALESFRRDAVHADGVGVRVAELLSDALEEFGGAVA